MRMETWNLILSKDGIVMEEETLTFKSGFLSSLE
jgi:hypothetical protein